MTKESTIDGITVIDYYFPIAEIQHEVAMKTSYLLRFQPLDTEGEWLDRYAMTEDETDLFMSFLKTGMSIIFGRIGTHTKNIDKAYKLEDDSAEDPDMANSMHFKMEWEGTANRNYIEPVGQHIFDAIVSYIIWRWLMLGKKKGTEEVVDSDSYGKGFGDALDNIQEDTGNLVKGIVERTPRIF